ncbi:transposase [Levilactobacillus brevis]|uniref:helix-turn-helix domain-containing protein n=1 Tax=Levilactobacillus brevis TaxID=1580 RepID=UPI000B3E7298|nr:helix-turn-helix domain-containing protein [Levilactobacillus brevis]ARW51204.1 hypothetical protein S101106_01741 [Levilactobacillus brevis]MCS8598181.1 transposase [Levilactobacillus brevis]MCT3563508.1 transposase [Levilactobacillus brevis]NRD28862.1 helix-turn-helix domain-containing protein [Levilactobacillus brevis]QCZ51241.1 transposase [Levilactobacillus brevis]
MGRKGSRYTIERKLFYIGLVTQGMAPYAVQRKYGIEHSQVSRWVKRFRLQGIDGLRHRFLRKYPSELKSKIVLEYLEGHTSYPQLCDKYNISNVSTIYQWVHRYTSGKQLTTRSVNPVKNGRKTTQLERVEIVQWIIENDIDYSRAMNKYDVSYGQVYSWTRKFKQGGLEALVDRRGKGKTMDQLTADEKRGLEVKRLKARIEHLSTENAVLKKLQELERLDAAHNKSTKQSKR